MTYGEAVEHNQILGPSQTYCAYCWKNQNWKSKHQGQASRADITNIGGGFAGQNPHGQVLNVMCL